VVFRAVALRDFTMLEWLDGYDDRDWRTDVDGTVRYALVGLGWWTVDVALPAIEASELGETTVLVSSTADKAGRVGDEHGVDRGISYDEFHDGAAAEEYDAVYVGTPNATHLAYAETAADLGKAVLCEKPLEATVERAERLVEACADVPLMVAYRMQTDPAVRRARELIAAGFVGDPVSVYGSNTQPLLEMIPDPGQWRLDPELSGYGASEMDLGIYSVNTTRFLLDRDPVLVGARMTSDHEAFADVPDQHSSSVFVFEDDVQAVTTASQHAQDDTHLTVVGTDGKVELSPAFHGECTLHLARGEVTATVEHGGVDVEREMTEEFDYFADRVLGDRAIYPDGEHGLVDMRVLEALHEAAKRDGYVEL
jgi:predicted dehydrogenase